MPTSTVPVNATALPAEPGFKPTRFSDAHLDFAADDSGAMQHVIDDEEKGGHTMPTLEGEHRRKIASVDIRGLPTRRAARRDTTDDPHEAFLVAFKTLIAAPWPVACTQAAAKFRPNLGQKPEL